MKREKWVERSFDFTLPPERFPALLQRLRGTPARLEDRTAPLSRDVLTRRADDRWSIQENIGHLLDLEPLWRRRTEQLLATEVELEPADMSNRRTREAEHNAREISGILADFRTARADLVRLMASADEAAVERSALHPRLGTPMRLIDLALFVAEHDDHHLVAISELLPV